MDEERLKKAFEGIDMAKVNEAFGKIAERLDELTKSMQKLFREEPPGPNPISPVKIRRAKARKQKRKTGGPR